MNEKPACGGVDFDGWYFEQHEASGFDLSSTARSHDLKVNDPNELQRIYAQRFQRNAEDRQRVWKVLTADYFQQFVPVDGVTLDLGTGWGEFISNIKSKTRYAMDLNPDAQAKADPQVNFLLQDCSAPWQLPDASLDVVFSSNFLEHLSSKDHVMDTILQARRCLKPGGRLLLLGPNVRYVGSEYWDFWDHHIALSDQSLLEALFLANFEIDRAIPRFLPFTMAKRGAPASALIRLYLKLPIVWPIFGKQFFLVARKPA